MKKLVYALVVVLFVACSSDDDNSTDNNQYANIQTDLPQGTWRVSNYTLNGEDRTQIYASYNFDFNVDGSVVATNDVLSEPGNWAYLTVDGEELRLLFTTQPPFDEIDENWDIRLASSTRIELEEQRSGVSKTMVFVKN